MTMIISCLLIIGSVLLVSCIIVGKIIHEGDVEEISRTIEE